VIVELAALVVAAGSGSGAWPFSIQLTTAARESVGTGPVPPLEVLVVDGGGVEVGLALEEVLDPVIPNGEGHTVQRAVGAVAVAASGQRASR
jgi:hypothetical protein